jgi:SAM-dependent methyltransferase
MTWQPREPADRRKVHSASGESVPIPPFEMRELVGPTEPEAFDNPSHQLVYPYLEPKVYKSVFDFGCGCGRIARQLILQDPQPDRYLGIDLHRGMIEWCKRNLAPFAQQFEFVHHDVHNFSFNPGVGKPDWLPFPAEPQSATFVNATSVFTHLTQAQAEYYLQEVARILSSDGVFQATRFLFDKLEFPMLQEEMNALYIAYQDPSAAVMFARDWVREMARAAGLVMFEAIPPTIRGLQWTTLSAPAAAGRQEVELPPDDAPIGLARPPRGPANPNRVGLD